MRPGISGTGISDAGISDAGISGTGISGTAISGSGTPESDWLAWPGLRPADPLGLADCARVVLVAPHPDDEVLGVGGLLRLLTARGVPVEIVAVTDGDASHPGSPTMTPGQLVQARRDESLEALRRLGVAPTVHRLGHGDGRVGESEGILTAYLSALLGPSDASTWCLATWEHDGHPDHEAIGRAARTACTATGARLLSYPVWTWHWARPADPRVPWTRARVVDLDAGTHAAKLAAVAAFGTQIRPLSDDPADAAVLPPYVLDRLTRPFEVVFS